MSQMYLGWLEAGLANITKVQMWNPNPIEVNRSQMLKNSNDHFLGKLERECQTNSMGTGHCPKGNVPKLNIF